MGESSSAAKWPGIDLKRLPRHIGIIMDGNGRWAKARGLSRLKGHREGAESVRTVVRTCRQLGVEALTLYAFSTENWGRPKSEIRGLMELLERFLASEEQEMIDQSIRLTTIGQTERLPRRLQAALKKTMAATAAGEAMVLNLALSYGSRAEIIAAARKAAAAVRAGRLEPEDIDEAFFMSQLQTAGLPGVDLIIRTSGEHRLSNFLLWQAAYAELVMVETYWPDFREQAFIEAVAEFQRRERRFGLTSAPAQKA